MAKKVSEEEVFALIAQQTGFDVDMIHRHTKLRDDLGADSLDLVEIELGVEDAFGVNTDMDESAEWDTAGDVADFVMARATG